MGLMDDELRAFWEPGAPSFNERLAGLRYTYEAGFETSVSAKPLAESQLTRCLLWLSGPRQSFWLCPG